MRNKISFLIASNGNRNNNLQIIIDKINTCNYPGDKEILVCSPRNPEINNIIYIEDSICNGPISAYNILANKSSGNILMILTDSTYPHDLSNFDEIFKNHTKNKKYQILGIKHGGVCWVDERLNLSYRPQIVRWPIISIDTFKNLGAIFNQNFKYHYCDSWISIWCYLNDCEIYECDELNLTNIPHESTTVFDNDDFIALQKLINNFPCEYNIKL